MEESAEIQLPPFCRAHGCEVCLAALEGEHPLGPSAAEREPPPLAPQPAPPAQQSVGVALIDEDIGVHALMKRIFEACDEFHSSGFFATAQAALEAIPGSDAGVLLVHLELPDDCGIRCALKLKKSLPPLKIVVTGRLHSQQLVRLAVGAGASTYLTRPFSHSQALTALRFAVSAPAAGHGPVLHKLTKREERVLEFLSRGLRYKEIQEALGCSESTMKKLQQRICEKLGARGTAEAVAKWLGFKSQR